MKKFIHTLFSATLFFFSVQVFAEELTVYSRTQTASHLDIGEKGYSVGDSIVRIGSLHFEENGPAVGNFYSKSELKHIDTNKKNDLRFFSSEAMLPNGSIFIMDFTIVAYGEVFAGAGHKHNGIILGGTDKYAGIRGTYDISVHPKDNKKSKITYNIIR